jgi:hypothetical protein
MPKEITSPSKSTFRQTVFKTDPVVYLWIFLKLNAFLATLKTSSIRDLFSRKDVSSCKNMNNRLARDANRFKRSLVSDHINLIPISNLPTLRQQVIPGRCYS